MTQLGYVIRYDLCINNKNKFNDIVTDDMLRSEFKTKSNFGKYVDRLLICVIPNPAPRDYNGPLGYEKSKKWLKMIENKDRFHLLLSSLMTGPLVSLFSPNQSDIFYVMISLSACLPIIAYSLKDYLNNEEKEELRLEINEINKRVKLLELQIKTNYDR